MANMPRTDRVLFAPVHAPLLYNSSSNDIPFYRPLQNTEDDLDNPWINHRTFVRTHLRFDTLNYFAKLINLTSKPIQTFAVSSSLDPKQYFHAKPNINNNTGIRIYFYHFCVKVVLGNVKFGQWPFYPGSPLCPTLPYTLKPGARNSGVGSYCRYISEKVQDKDIATMEHHGNRNVCGLSNGTIANALKW